MTRRQVYLRATIPGTVALLDEPDTATSVRCRVSAIGRIDETIDELRLVIRNVRR